MTIKKNNNNQYKLLLKVLCGEIVETDSKFQHWLNQDIENRKLYSTLKGEDRAHIQDVFFDKDQAYRKIKFRLGLNTRKKIPFYRKDWVGYVASMLFVALIGITGIYSLKTLRHENTNKIAYQTIYVPKGEVFEMLLSDSTKVFLNSDTKLIFPKQFNAKSRQVELIGEAYFEVKKGDVPFIVNAAGMHITVTGTAFNVNAYQNNILFSTTLVEGSVDISVPSKPEIYSLTSGNNFSFNKNSDEISIQEVETEIFTAWMRGEFIFRNQSLEEIFNTLQRCYDFEIVYEKPAIKNMRFSGSVEKKRPLKYFLNQLQIVTEIKYRNEEEKILLY